MDLLNYFQPYSIFAEYLSSMDWYFGNNSALGMKKNLVGWGEQEAGWQQAMEDEKQKNTPPGGTARPLTSRSNHPGGASSEEVRFEKPANCSAWRSSPLRYQGRSSGRGRVQK